MAQKRKTKRMVSLGECMLELSGGDGSLYRLGFAGDTLNTAYYARARFGLDWDVDYFTALGDDPYSDRMLAFLTEQGIGTGHIRRVPGKRPGLYLIHQADGDRAFTYWRENAAARQLADDPEALQEALAGAALIYFSGITLAILAPEARTRLLEAIGAARADACVTAFDPNIRPALWPDAETVRETITRAAAAADIVLPTFADEAPYFGDTDAEATAGRYLDAGVSEVVVKGGAESALIARPGDRFEVPAEKGVVPVDPTGAGDSFNGTYLAARMSGEEPLPAARAAHRTAAIVIGHQGALVAPKDLPVNAPGS